MCCCWRRAKGVRARARYLLWWFHFRLRSGYHYRITHDVNTAIYWYNNWISCKISRHHFPHRHRFHFTAMHTRACLFIHFVCLWSLFLVEKLQSQQIILHCSVGCCAAPLHNACIDRSFNRSIDRDVFDRIIIMFWFSFQRHSTVIIQASSLMEINYGKSHQSLVSWLILSELYVHHNQWLTAYSVMFTNK